MNNNNTTIMTKINAENKPKIKQKKKRCNFKNCNKKLGLTVTKCKCLKLFCSLHRLPEDHDCSYDYVKNGREILEKNNPLIIKNKVVPI